MTILTIDDLERAVPAAFADEPADRVSDRYSFISTKDIIHRLTDLEWYPVEASQSAKVHDQGHTTHMITFRKRNPEIRIDGVTPQITMFNNHMALRRASMRAGFYKWLCKNGLVVAVPGMVDERFDKIHIDDAAFEFEQAFTIALNRLESATEQIEQWQNTELTYIEAEGFAARAVLIRNHNDPVWSGHFDPHNFLNRRRNEDFPNNLWTIFNVVQENIMKGGVPGAVRLTKPITQVSEVQRINEGLWQLATEFGNLHGTN